MDQCFITCFQATALFFFVEFIQYLIKMTPVSQISFNLFLLIYLVTPTGHFSQHI